MRKQVDSTVERATAANQTAGGLTRQNLRLVYSRGRREVDVSSGDNRLASLTRSGSSRPPRSAMREDWPSWLKGAVLWELAVLAAMLTLLLMVGRRKSAWS